MQRFAIWGRRRLRGDIRRAGLGLGAILAGLLCSTGRAQFDFSTATEVTGLWGTQSVDNSSGGDVDGINIAGQAPNAPVWFKWTPPEDAPDSAEVTVDTIGSVDASGMPLDTTLAVFAGNDVTDLYQVAGNDDLYPNNPLQFNVFAENFYSFNANNNPPVTISSFVIPQSSPFPGPSVVRFIAKKGVTYYFAADTKQQLPPKSATGTISLNWAYHSSGALRFASEKVELGGLVDANSNPMLFYECAETEGYARVTVTRVGGYSGRIAVDYETTDLADFADADGFLPNGDEPAVDGTDYMAVTGTLIFDDFEMSKSINIPVLPNPLPVYINQHGNHAFAVTLTAAQLDASETTDVSDPRVDPVYGQIAVRVLNNKVSPIGVDRVIRTNTIPATTNWVTTNVFNFDLANYRVTRPGTTNATKSYTIFVNRGGTDTNAITIQYRVTSGYPILASVKGFDTEENIYFPLMPGSDYATPDPADITAKVLGRDPDYTFSGGYTGDVVFGTKKPNVVERQSLTFTVYNNGLSQFDEDFHIELYTTDSSGVVKKDVGMIGETTVTLLFQDRNAPAGSVDQEFNADFNLNLDGLQVITSPPNMTHPGTDGQVYGVAAQSDNKSVIVGDFFSYNGFSRNCVARINADGSLDTSFNPGSGIGAIAGYTDLPLFINDLALDPDNNNVVIAGSFTSFNGVPRGNVARLTSSGALDATFNPGAGANGPVWAVYRQPVDGKIVIGGDFTSYNGVPRKNIARLNSDGSLDSSFNASNAFTAPIYALAEQNGTFISIDRTANGTDLEDDNTVNVGADSGVLTVDYDMAFVPDDLRVYYGGTNGVLLYDSGMIAGTGRAVVPFGPTNGLTTNVITIVMNQGSGIPGTAWFYTASVQSSAANQLYVGGDFTAVGGIAGQDHIARLLASGAVDTTFNPNAGADGTVYALSVQPDGKLLAGGEFTHFNNLNFNRLVRLTTGGALDTNFFNGSGVDGTVFHLNAQTNGTIYVGGAFTSVNGTHRLGFARLNGDGTVDTTFLDTAYNQFAGLPRRYFSDPLGTVFSSAVQPNGGVIIGGSFDQVGGGQFDAKVRPDSLDINQATVPHTRDGIRNRSNVARLVGGATPGPGNIGLLFDNYSVGKSGSALYVSLLRTNGYLGNATANFSVAPGLAQSGLDFYYNSPAPVYGVSWEFWGSLANSRPFTRMHSDGLFGTNTFLHDSFRVLGTDTASQVIVSVINNTTTSGDLSAQFQLNNPGNSDLFYLGGQNMPLGVALGVSSAPLNIVDDHHQSGVVGFGKTDYVGSIRN
ncbi:MAG: hypothetical protein NTZ16_09315, partial [Verrucomicrobia bacterium]|nr:hypothetical protein [Verrucomicrobiota bacterium]